jgi:hypothetical protein
MEIVPHLGIGDLLALAMSVKSNNLNIKKITLSTDIIYNYKLYPENYIIFLKKFINFIFPEPEIIIEKKDYKSFDFKKYPIINTYIFDENKYILDENKYENYIIFHTKVRLDGCMNKFYNEDLPKLNIFFENFKTNYNIIIMGERNIEDCLEKKVHNITQIYNSLLLLKKNNNVIDLTKNELYSGNPDFNDFLNEIKIINKAKYNIIFGIGGPLTICQAFSKNNISYISNFKNYVTDYYEKLNKNIYRNIDNFIENIKINLNSSS